MSKNKPNPSRPKTAETTSLNLSDAGGGAGSQTSESAAFSDTSEVSAVSPQPSASSTNSFGARISSAVRGRWWVFVVVGVLSLSALGAGLKYLEAAAARQVSERNRATFLAPAQESALSAVNPFLAAVTPAPTPQLSKEYIYAGSRLLAVEDTGAQVAPSVTPTPTSTPTPTPTPAVRTNYALAANGSTATASSADGSYPVSFIINGNRPGTNVSVWISGVGLPQWAEVNFNQSRTIDEINVITVQDNYQNPVEPTLATTFTSTHANTGFEVQYWDGAAWVNIAAVTGNDKVWRQFTFSPLTTSKIRVNVTATGDNYAYLTEVEALGSN